MVCRELNLFRKNWSAWEQLRSWSSEKSKHSAAPGEASAAAVVEKVLVIVPVSVESNKSVGLFIYRIVLVSPPVEK